MEIRQLRYFISVANHLNFTRAARECFVVQTTMTHQIAALEKELGVRLFERTKRKVLLTPEGEAFLPEAKAIVHRMDDSLEIMRTMKGNYKGSLRIGYWGNLYREDLPMILRAYRKKNPLIRVSLVQENVDDLLTRLEERKLDAALLCYFSMFEDLEWLESQILFEDRLFALLPRDHPLSDYRTLSRDMIREEPMITFPGVGATDLCRRLGKSGSISMIEEHHKSITMLVEAGYGISLCAERGLVTDSDFLCTVPMDDSVGPVQGALCWHREQTADHVLNFVEDVRDWFAAQREPGRGGGPTESEKKF